MVALKIQTKLCWNIQDPVALRQLTKWQTGQFLGESGRSGMVKQQFHNRVTLSPPQSSHGGCVAVHSY